MNETRIPVDFLNPGHVFASLGVLEVLNALDVEALGRFCWDEEQFAIRCTDDANPVDAVIRFLHNASVRALIPSRQSTEIGWPIETVQPSGVEFPVAAPETPATLPAIVSELDASIRVHSWAERVRDNVKFWAGARGYPGTALLRDMVEKSRSGSSEELRRNPFDFGVPLSSSFRFDWRRDYVPLDVGFSPNAQTSVEMVGYPLVEALAVIGLRHARPKRHEKLAYTYSIVADFVPFQIHAAALGCVTLPWLQRTFRMTLGWPGQEGQARCINNVTEEFVW